MLAKRALVITLLLVSTGGTVLALGRPENVLVVQNGNSTVSTHIASYYVSKRGIPAGNLITVYAPDSSTSTSNEYISLSNYQTLVEQPIKAYLSANNLTSQIQYIVLTKGVPLNLTNDSLGGPYGGRSVDSKNNYYGTALINRYWRATEPFTHAAYGGYIVTRLDGYTESDAKALVDQALAPAPVPYRIFLDADSTKGMGDPSVQPKCLLLPNGEMDPDYVLQYSDYNADMTRAVQLISERPHLSVTYDQTAAFASSADPLGSYVSWGSNDSAYSAATYLALPFTACSIAETAVSTSARTFLPTTGGQSLIADLIAHGTAGAKGYSTEPFLDAVASPSVLLDNYTSGRNLAESYFAASRFLAWRDVIVGDPLCSLSGNSATTIASTKLLPDGWLVSLEDKQVSAGTDDFGSMLYIEEDDRSSGIQIRLGKISPESARGCA